MSMYDLFQFAGQGSSFIDCSSNPVMSKLVRQFIEKNLIWTQFVDEGIVVVNLQKQIVFANQFVAKITRLKKNEIGSMSVDQLLKIKHKSWVSAQETHNGVQGKYPYQRFKAKIMRKEQNTIIVTGISAQIIWVDQPAIMLIFKAMNKIRKKERALKFGIKKLRNRCELKYYEQSWVKNHNQRLQQELEKAKHHANHLNKELVYTNNALSALARQMDKEKKEFESEISRSIITNILPIIKTLQKDTRLSPYSLELNLLESYIGALSPEGMKNQGLFSCLSETEGVIASLIKKGMTSKKIAALLCISAETVRTHRKNIRKKLKIQNTDVNLRTHLNRTE